MKWIKEVIVDIVVTIAILLAVNLDVQWLGVVVISYSVLMLVLKVIVLFTGGSPLQKKQVSLTAPPGFIYFLYALNIVILLVYQWWITASIWAMIWIFSWLALKKFKIKK